MTTRLNDIFIRKARRKDRMEMKACNERNLPDNYELVYWESQLLNFPGLSFVLVEASDDKTVHGYLFGNSEGIISLAVDEKFRRKGYARDLMTCFINASSSAPSLSLQVREGNHPAKALYDSLNFKLDKIIPNYYSNPTENGECRVWVRENR